MSGISPGGRPARTEPGELVSAASAVLLLASMFALAWYGTVRPPGKVTGAGLQSSEDAWNGLSDVRWILLAASLLAVSALALHVSQAGHGTKTETGLVVGLSGGACGVLLVWRVLINLPQPEQVDDAKLGAYLGLLFAWGVALGGWRTIVFERDARRHAARAPRAVRSAPR